MFASEKHTALTGKLTLITNSPTFIFNLIQWLGNDA